jgi:hypothetical protein
MERRTAGRLVLEMSVIVFSVVVALAANEWRQGAARKATISTVLETLKSEVQTNRGHVQRALAHHQDLIGQLRSGGIVMTRFDLREQQVDTTSAAGFARTITQVARRLGAPANIEFAVTRLADGRWELDSADGQVWVTIEGDTATVRGRGNISLQPPFLIDSAWETAQITQAAVHIDPAIITAMARIRELHRRMDATVARLIDILYGTASARSDILSALQDLVTYEEHTLAMYDELLARLGTGSSVSN